MTSEIQIGEKTVKLRATAALPRLYRIKFGRDILKDFLHLQKVLENSEEKREIAMADMGTGIFENIAYIMARHAAPEETPQDQIEWLEQFEAGELYSAYVPILKFFSQGMNSSVDTKKN